MNKGKVVDIQKKYVVVINDQMSYERIKNKNGLTVGKEIYYFKEDLYKQSKQPVKKYFLVAAVLFMMLFIQPLLVAEEAYGYISVDINPSIELEVNRTLEVLSIEAMNDDAKSIIRDEWIGKPAKEVIDLIIEETQNKGILNKERDFVLVSYYFNDEDPASGEVFVQSLDQLFNEKSHDYEVAVIKSDAKTHSEAKEAKESLGKQVVNKKMNTKVKDLLAAKESIEKDEDFKIYKNNNDDSNDDKDHEYSNEKALEENPGQKNEKNPIFGERDDVPGLNKQNNNKKEENEDKRDSNDDREGYNRTKKMITPPEAKAIALVLVNGRIIEVELDRDNSEAEYEIKILSNKEIHEFIIDGYTGEILSHKIDGINDDLDNEENNNGKNNTHQEDEKDIDDNEKLSDEASSNEFRKIIERKDIEEIVYREVSDDAEIVSFELDRDDDKAEYKMELIYDNNLHQIEIDGYTGKIIEYEVDSIDTDEDEKDIDDEKLSEESSNNEFREIIERKGIEEIVFKEVSEDAEIVNFELDRDDDKAEYKMELIYDNNLHQIEIDGYTGKIIEYEVDSIDTDEDEKDIDDEKLSEESSNNEFREIIERKGIEEIVFKEVSEDAEIVNFELDQDDDKAEYKVELIYDNNLHQIEIDGFTGKIIEHEVDSIDTDEDEKDTDDN